MYCCLWSSTPTAEARGLPRKEKVEGSAKFPLLVLQNTWGQSDAHLSDQEVIEDVLQLRGANCLQQKS